MPHQPSAQTQQREVEAPLPEQRRALDPGSASWAAFGGSANLVVADRRKLEVAADLAQSLVAEVHRRCSARLPGSDLARANAAAGTWVEVDPLLIEAVTAAVRVAEATAGLVGPLDWARIEVDPDPAVSRLRVPAGGRVDLGTMLRAFAADLVAEAVPRRARTAMIIGLGGDVAVGARTDHPQQWRVTLSESTNEAELPEQVLLEVGGLATVALPTTARGRSGVPHLLDPRTGLPVEVIWRSVTVSAASCLDAHAAAAAALVMGDLAPAWLWEHDLAARLIATDSHTMRVAGWPEYRPSGQEQLPGAGEHPGN